MGVQAQIHKRPQKILESIIAIFEFAHLQCYLTHVECVWGAVTSDKRRTRS